jgi:hypothetical protein
MRKNAPRLCGGVQSKEGFSSCSALTPLHTHTSRSFQIHASELVNRKDLPCAALSSDI